MRLEAENVRILVAEDNEINREVVLDILEPLNMQIKTAVNGDEAYRMAVEEPFDLIFMDYLMPVMNGAEATDKLRHTADREDLKELPVIALTASSDEIDRLLDSGMNDYIIKPMSFDGAVEKLVKWLPKGSVYAVDKGEEAVSEEEAIGPIEGINIEAGITNSGSLRLLKKLFADYSGVIEFKASQIESLLRQNKIDDYRIEVHAIKSSSNLIGALELSKGFAMLEQKAKDYELDGLMDDTEEVLFEYRSFKDRLKVYSDNKYSQSLSVSNKRVISILKKIVSDAEAFFLDGVDMGITELDKCVLPTEIKEDFENLRIRVSDVAMAQAIDISKEMIDKLEVLGA